MTLRDTPDHYGLVSRALHWGMALLLTWQFLSMAAKYVLGRGPITAVMVGSHQSVGVVLLVLVLVRALWGFYNWRRRPHHGTGFWGRAASIGHFTLYALMLVVPALGMIRQRGSDRPTQLFGQEVMPGLAEPVGWMVWLGDSFHSELAWLLCALIVGHIAMVVVHQVHWRDGTLRRMAGPVRAEG